MIQTILLATDGSDASERAAHYAAPIAIRFLAGVVVVHAYPPVPAYLGEPNYSRALDASLEAARSIVEKAAAMLRETGVAEVETDELEGPAANVILEVAETRRPDLIILGARGLSTWQGMLLGSVSMAVTQRAECPVSVVK